MKSYLLLSIARIRIADDYALPVPWRSWVDPRPPIVDPRTADDPVGRTCIGRGKDTRSTWVRT